MKALILAAGLGTRLLPYSQVLPKPLFTLNNKPMLIHAIESLEACGCDSIFINTHHLSEKIDQFIRSQQFKAQIQLLHEPRILDTGGAIANAWKYINKEPIIVVNADVISNVDLNKVYKAHVNSNMLATLVLHDCEEFNTVQVDKTGLIQNFDGGPNSLAFTGLQILSPEIFEYFPDTPSFSSIMVYKTLCKEKKVKAWIEKDLFWSDIGTVSSYSQTSRLTLAAQAINLNFDRIHHIMIKPVAGDGSDRKWFRACYKDQSCMICDHGICLPDTDQERELMAFVQIGNHLKNKKINLPQIFCFDRVSGMVSLEDLGSVHLQDWIQKYYHEDLILNMYKTVIDELIRFSRQGIKSFNSDWCCQTKTYSKALIIDKECLYFLKAFVNGYLNKQIDSSYYTEEFESIADHALKDAVTGLMHRDFQSRNIMIKDDRPFLIDFQSARSGPLQYDLASLLIDPYADLSIRVQEILLDYTLAQLHLDDDSKPGFIQSYRFCCLTRNLQMLGAFGYLTQTKKKTWFEQYIPKALQSLKHRVQHLTPSNLPRLCSLVGSL